MQKMIVLLVILVAALVGIQSCTGQCYAAPGPESNEERLFAQDVCGGVDNNPTNPTTFTTDETRTITKIGTYHWNHGAGAALGTIGLRDQNGKVWGPWQASGLDGSGGVPNAYWVVQLTPALDLPAGAYTIVDSDPSTWAQNSESENSGIASIIALKAGNNEVQKAPCAGDGAVDLSPGTPTDQYSAGPRLAPGSYKVWYGKRTGTNIGQPDKWNTYGPVELLSGKFYIFDVTTGELHEANPKMVNPMLSDPTPGESVVWYKRSTQYAYVVCFEGPLSKTSEGTQLVGSWKMAGHQTGFNDWEADLVLNDDGTMSWTETKGANVGATRTGTWQFDGTAFTMNWVSPGGGKTSWISHSVTENSISDGTYTVESAPGGTWSATRSATKATEGF